ncbi:protein fanH [Providencia rustigianii]|uniref:protein fanH n=1 Tax=Providencia rustigianii TaxID=158850 RepID=UPI00223EE40D|nr:protein fanH [Providencia rustigianii]
MPLHYASQSVKKPLNVSIILSKAQCKINNGSGVSGSYLLPMINTSGKIVGSKNYTTVPIMIDCTAGGNINQLEITFGDNSNKKIDSTTWSTTNSNLGIRFSWTKDKQQNFSLGSVQDINKPNWMEASKKFNASVDVSPVVLNQKIQGGQYTSSLPVTITFI